MINEYTRDEALQILQPHLDTHHVRETDLTTIVAFLDAVADLRDADVLSTMQFDALFHALGLPSSLKFVQTLSQERADAEQQAVRAARREARRVVQSTMTFDERWAKTAQRNQKAQERMNRIAAKANAR